MDGLSGFLQHLLNGIGLGAVYALVALGYTIIFGVLKLINFAHGDVFMVGAYVGYFFAKLLGISDRMSPGMALLTLLVSMLVSALLGVTIERLAYRPLRRAPRINALITAIGVSMLLQYGGQIVFGPDHRSYPTVDITSHLDLPMGLIFSGVELLVLLLAFSLMLLLLFIIKRTKFGLALRALSEDFSAAALMGVPVNRTIVMTFALSAALAAAAGMMVGMNYRKIEPLMGNLWGLKAFVAAVLGGIGQIHGAALGGLLLGMGEEMVTGYGSSNYRDALAFVVLIVVLLVRPQGLFGKNEVEKV